MTLSYYRQIQLCHYHTNLSVRVNVNTNFTSPSRLPDLIRSKIDGVNVVKYGYFPGASGRPKMTETGKKLGRGWTILRRATSTSFPIRIAPPPYLPLDRNL